MKIPAAVTDHRPLLGRTSASTVLFDLNIWDLKPRYVGVFLNMYVCAVDIGVEIL